MLYKYKSAKSVIQGVMSRFKVTDANIVFEALEWIGTCIALIGTHANYVNEVKLVEVDFHKIAIPENFYQLNFISYNGQKLKHGIKRNPARHVLTDEDNRSVVELVQALAAKYNLIESIENTDSGDWEQLEDLTTKEYNLNKNIEILYNSVNNSPYYSLSEWYSDGEGCYNTSVECGTVVLCYKAYPLDKEGFPLIIDEAKYTLALEWYVMRCLIEGGFKHPTLSYADVDAKTNQAIARATNEHLKMTYEEMDVFTSKWTNMTFRLREDNTNYYSN